MVSHLQGRRKYRQCTWELHREDIAVQSLGSLGSTEPLKFLETLETVEFVLFNLAFRISLVCFNFLEVCVK